MHCPVCRNVVERVHRHPLERFISVFYLIHRYRCVQPDCGWEGTLHRDGTEVDPDHARKAAFSRLFWFLLGAAMLYAGQMAVRYYPELTHPQDKTLPIFALYEEDTPIRVLRGQDQPGEQLAKDDPRGIDNDSKLKIRKGCVWGVAGRNPYKGTVADALAGTGLPREVILKFDDMVKQGLVTARLDITNQGIVTEDDKKNFGKTAASMAFGDTLCFNTRVNFRNGHVEQADLYEATDSRGEGYAIMIPYACNNVSVLGKRKRNGNGGGNGGDSIPEPRVVLLFALGLLIMGALTRRRQA
jgi:hypothetical protein